MAALSTLRGEGSAVPSRQAGELSMFRRRIVVFRRPRLLGAALVGGLGFAAGRASKRTSQVSPATSPAVPGPDSADLMARLKELSEMHESGALTDAEFAAAKARLLET